MSYVFFQNVLNALGKRINYDAVANLAGNSFAKNAFDAIQHANPLIKESKGRTASNFFSNVNFTKIAVNQNKEQAKEQKLEGLDWLTLGDIMSAGEDKEKNESE